MNTKPKANATKEISVSVIIIGRNANLTLIKCIETTLDALNFCSSIKQYEIIYVDSNSTDNSLEIAKAHNAETVEIVDGFTTAALGRYLGVIKAKHNYIQFLDCDMYLNKNWFNEVLKYIHQFKMFTTDYDDILYNKKFTDVVAVRKNILGYETLSEAKNFSSFLFCDQSIFEIGMIMPMLKIEEERNFIAQVYRKEKLIAIPGSFFTHNHNKTIIDKLNHHATPKRSYDYITSLFLAIQHNFMAGYIKTNSRLTINAITSIIFYVLLFIKWPIAIIFSITSIFFNQKKYWKVNVIELATFPLKIIAAIYYWFDDKWYNFELSNGQTYNAKELSKTKEKIKI